MKLTFPEFAFSPDWAYPYPFSYSYTYTVIMNVAKAAVPMSYFYMCGWLA